MASRKEEKERLRQERLEREQAEARKAGAKRRLQMVFGALLAAAAVAAIAIAVLSGGDDDGTTETQGDSGPTTPIPPKAITDLTAAAKAAGCKLETFPSKGRTHVGDEEDVPPSAWNSNPPTSGTHRQTPAQDGIYEPGNEPDMANLVHTLEHGRIVYFYKPRTPARQISQLETLVNEPLKGAEGYHQVLVQNNTEATEAVGAVAWTQKVGCPEFNDKVFDVLRAFREKYVDKGPELVA